jgi:hypothetical protein
MEHLQANNTAWTKQRRTGEEARALGITLVVVFLLLGITVSGLWLYRAAHSGPATVSGEPTGSQPLAFSDSTKAVLARLDSPLEVRFYALLDPATVPDSVTAFAGRVGQLLTAYQQEAAGKIKITSFNSPTKGALNAATADGITVFNLDKGEACYLGVTLVLNGRKDTLSHLSPEWEQALEPDLTRAIIRLMDVPRSVTIPTTVSQINTAAIQEVRALIPNLAAVSVESGKQILRDAALKDFTAAAKEMQAQVKEAEQRLTQAQQGGTDVEQQAAMKHLQQVQAEQTDKLKAIAAKSKVQVDTFEQLKAAPH